jgi:type III restriction enzyme
MKLKFKHQKFQADAANAVCDVFNGQPFLTQTYLIDRGLEETNTLAKWEESNFTGFRNQKIVPELTEEKILENINRIQRSYLIEPSERVEPFVVERENTATHKKERVRIPYNLTIEMETGVGKTYTYIKTMFELNKRYGWSKFIVVVPSVAIREGVYKTFQITQDHFAEEYGKKIRFFLYNSAQLTELDRFASGSSMNAIIINSQAFNARGKDARRIYMKLDSFRSRRPIDVVAATNPIMIIDEPQSVEGAATKERLTYFNPLMILRYSATHRKDSIYNMIYRLDAMDAYNQKLVKKIAVKGISVSGTTATNSYLYLESVDLSKDKAPAAYLEFEAKGASGIRKVTHKVTPGYNLYEHSKFDKNSEGLEEYKGFTVTRIDGRTNTVYFENGVSITAGDVMGATDEDQIRRIQIRETIETHLERERQLFHQGIKVLSLFFIDEVAKYKQYDKDGNEKNGLYADMFEEEYRAAVENWQLRFGEDDYVRYLSRISAHQTHAGYFSIDRKSKRIVDSKLGNRREKTSDDVDAYDLIMKNKERLLDFKEPVRFIFSHSALREGWDNPNVFQICTLKQSGSDVRKRQEVGRGLRLCVNQDGERMDENVLGGDVQKINVLTVVANESYDSFSRALQTELAEVVADRPREVTAELFENKTITDINGKQIVIDHHFANRIHNFLLRSFYVDDDNTLTQKYYDDVKSGAFHLPDELADCQPAVEKILGSIYNPQAMQPEDARNKNVESKLNEEKLHRKEFQELWKRINSKSAYLVSFDTDELIRKSIDALDRELQVSHIFVKVEQGDMESIQSKEALQNAQSFRKDESSTTLAHIRANDRVKYDLIGKIVSVTDLTRKAVVVILKGIRPETFQNFQHNPEEFILRVSKIINEQKSAVIIEHITYHKLDESYSEDLFTQTGLKGRLGANAIKTEKNLYDYLVYDSDNERKFAEQLEVGKEVAVYVKLPSGFFISTPVGKYNPDWAIAFTEGTVKHIYFVAETKGDLSSMQLRKAESLKIECARKHFAKISSDSVKYDVVDNYQTLLNKVMK